MSISTTSSFSADVTWLLPVRNAIPYLRQTLESMAAQTYSRFTVLAWDDGSSDGTLDELRAWIPSRLPGRIIATPAVGIGTALANLVQQAETELCARIDGDDINEPMRLQQQVDYLTHRPSVALVGTQVSHIDEHGKALGTISQHPLDDCDIRWSLRFTNPINHPTVMFRRSAVLASGNYRDLKPGQDYDLWVRFAQRYRMANLSQPLLRYRLHAGSVTAAHSGQAGARRRQRRQALAPLLFPKLSEAEVARLTSALQNPDELDVTLADIRLLRRAAVFASEVFGDCGDYFQRSALYRHQYQNLMTRWLKGRRMMRSVWPLMRRTARWVGDGGARKAA
jgi:glycosyltransferase involved in cell wall biosynthesis